MAIGDEPKKEDEIPSEEGEPQMKPVSETEGAQAPEAETPEKEFNQRAEVAKVEARFKERMDKWREVMLEAFINDDSYKMWLNYEKDNKGQKPEKDSPAERLIPMAQKLQEKQFEIIEEKDAAILSLDKKRDEIRMKKIEEI